VAGDRKLSIVKRERGVADVGVGNELRAPFDLFVEEVGMLAMEQIDGCGIGGTVTGEQAFRLSLVCGKRLAEGDGLQIHGMTSHRGAFGEALNPLCNAFVRLGGVFMTVMQARRANALDGRFREARKSGRILG